MDVDGDETLGERDGEADSVLLLQLRLPPEAGRGWRERSEGGSGLWAPQAEEAWQGVKFRTVRYV